LAAAVNDVLAQVVPAAAHLPTETVRTYIGEGARLLLTRSLGPQGTAADVERVLPLFLDSYRRVMLRTTRALSWRDSLPRRPARPHAGGLEQQTRRHEPRDSRGAWRCGSFALIWGADDVAERKPDPAGLLRLMSLLGVAAAETLMSGTQPPTCAPLAPLACESSA